MSERFTIVFEGDIRKFVGNPLKTETPFGVPYTVAVGDIIEQFNELQDSGHPAPPTHSHATCFDLAQVLNDIYTELGCEHDNEAALEAIAKLKEHRSCTAINSDVVREQIARMIDPYAWSDPENMTPTERVLFDHQSAHRRDTSYAKADEIIAALVPAPIEAGWRDSAVVPIEPTREMWAAAGDAVVKNGNVHHDVIAGAVWRAMLSAAPSASRNEGNSHG